MRRAACARTPFRESAISEQFPPWFVSPRRCWESGLRLSSMRCFSSFACVLAPDVEDRDCRRLRHYRRAWKGLVCDGTVAVSCPGCPTALYPPRHPPCRLARPPSQMHVKMCACMSLSLFPRLDVWCTRCTKATPKSRGWTSRSKSSPFAAWIARRRRTLKARSQFSGEHATKTSCDCWMCRYGVDVRW